MDYDPQQQNGREGSRYQEFWNRVASSVADEEPSKIVDQKKFAKVIMKQQGRPKDSATQVSFQHKDQGQSDDNMEGLVVGASGQLMKSEPISRYPAGTPVESQESSYNMGPARQFAVTNLPPNVKKATAKVVKARESKDKDSAAGHQLILSGSSIIPNVQKNSKIMQRHMAVLDSSQLHIAPSLPQNFQLYGRSQSMSHIEQANESNKQVLTSHSSSQKATPGLANRLNKQMVQGYQKHHYMLQEQQHQKEPGGRGSLDQIIAQRVYTISRLNRSIEEDRQKNQQSRAQMSKDIYGLAQQRPSQNIQISSFMRSKGRKFFEPNIDRLFKSDHSKSQIEINQQVDSFAAEMDHNTSYSHYSMTRDNRVYVDEMNATKELELILGNRSTQIDLPTVTEKQMKTGGLSNFSQLAMSQLQGSRAFTSSYDESGQKDLISSQGEKLSYLAPINMAVNVKHPNSRQEAVTTDRAANGENQLPDEKAKEENMIMEEKRGQSDQNPTKMETTAANIRKNQGILSDLKSQNQNQKKPTAVTTMNTKRSEDSTELIQKESKQDAGSLGQNQGQQDQTNGKQPIEGVTILSQNNTNQQSEGKQNNDGSSWKVNKAKLGKPKATQQDKSKKGIRFKRDSVRAQSEIWLKKVHHIKHPGQKSYFGQKSQEYENQFVSNLQDSFPDLPIGQDGKSIDTIKVEKDLNRYNAHFQQIHERYNQNFSKKVLTRPKFDELSQLQQIQNSAKLLPFIQKMKSVDLKDSLWSSINSSRMSTIDGESKQYNRGGMFKINRDAYQVRNLHSQSQNRVDHFNQVNQYKKILKKRRQIQKSGMFTIQQIDDLKEKDIQQVTSKDIYQITMNDITKTKDKQSKQICAVDTEEGVPKKEQFPQVDYSKLEYPPKHLPLPKNKLRAAYQSEMSKDKYPEIYQNQHVYERKMQQLWQEHHITKQSTNSLTSQQILKKMKDHFKQSLLNAQNSMNNQDSTNPASQRQSFKSKRSHTASDLQLEKFQTSHRNKSSMNIVRPVIDYMNKDLDADLVGQLDQEAEMRERYKALMKRQKQELPKEEQLWEAKMKWLTEEVPKLVMHDGINVLQMKEDDEGDDSWQTQLFQNCRTNNLIWHLKALDDPLMDKMKEVNEMIKDVPVSDDPIYLMEFSTRRKKEKAADAARQASFVDERNEAQKRMDTIKSLYKMETFDNIKKLDQTIEKLEELTPMQKLLLEFKGRVVHYTAEGKIDVFKVLQKFQGLRKHTKYDYNPKNFSFEQVAKELTEDLNRVWVKRQNSRDMDYIFEGKNEGPQRNQKDLARFLNSYKHLDQFVEGVLKLERKNSKLQKYNDFFGQKQIDEEGKQMDGRNAQDSQEGGESTAQTSQALQRLQTMRLRPHVCKIQRQKSLETTDFVDYAGLDKESKQTILSDLMARIEQFQKYKDSLNDSQVQKMIDHPYFLYLSECINNIDLVLPILSKVKGGTLALTEYSIQDGHAKGLKAAGEMEQSLLHKVVLKRNDLKDEQFAQILEGLSLQLDLKRLIYSGNQLGLKSMIRISKILQKNIPFQLTELRLVNCQIKQNDMVQLLTLIAERNFLSTVHLVQMPLESKQANKALCNFIRLSKHLKKIDLSNNKFAERHPSNKINLLRVLSRSRYLTDVNLSYNLLFDNPKERIEPPPETQKKADSKKKKKGKKAGSEPPRTPAQISVQTLKYLRKLIIKNKGLYHLDLSSIGLHSFQILHLCKYIQRKHAEQINSQMDSLMNVHFCQNVHENDESIPEMIARIQAILSPRKWVDDDKTKSRKLRALHRALRLLKKEYFNYVQGVPIFYNGAMSQRMQESAPTIPKFQGKGSSHESKQMSQMHQDVMITRQINQRKSIEINEIDHERNVIHPNNRYVTDGDLQTWQADQTGKLILSLSPDLMKLFRAQHMNVFRARTKKLSSHDLQALDEDTHALKDNWKILSREKPHTCPVCDLERLSIVFWSKKYCQQSRSHEFIDEDLFYEEKAEEIFRKWEKQQFQERIAARDECSLNDDFNDDVMICGSFTEWQPQAMMKLTEVLDSAYIQEPDVLQRLQKGKRTSLMKSTMSIDQERTFSSLTNKYHSKKHDDLRQILLDQKRQDWPNVLKHCLKYREPGVVNGTIIRQLQDITDIDDIYVYIGFMKPGKSNFVVRYREQESSSNSDGAVPGGQQQETELLLNQYDTLDTKSSVLRPKDFTMVNTTPDDTTHREQTTQQGVRLHTLRDDCQISLQLNMIDGDRRSHRDQYFHGRAIIDIRTEEFHKHQETSKLVQRTEENYATSDSYGKSTFQPGRVTFQKSMSVFADLPATESQKMIKNCWDSDKPLLLKSFKLLEKTRYKVDKNSKEIKSLVLQGRLSSTSEEMTKGFRVFNEIEIAKFESIVREFYPSIKYLYSLLQSGITDMEQYPYVSQQQIIDFCYRTGLSRGLGQECGDLHDGREINESEESDDNDVLDDKFCMRKSRMSKEWAELIILKHICSKVSKEGQFLRYELVEFLIRLSKYQFLHNIKPWAKEDSQESVDSPILKKPSDYMYGRANLQYSISNQFENLIKKLVIPNLCKFEIFDPQFREKQLYTSAELSEIFTSNVQPLYSIFRSKVLAPNAQAFGGSAQERNQYRQSVPIDQIVEIFENKQNNDIGVTKGQMVSCFALSKRPVEKEVYIPHEDDPRKPKEIKITILTSKQEFRLSPFTQRLTYAEFLELICRVAACKFYDTQMEHTYSLSQKVLCLLDDLFQSLGVQAKDPLRLPLASQLPRNLAQMAQDNADGQTMQLSDFQRSQVRRTDRSKLMAAKPISSTTSEHAQHPPKAQPPQDLKKQQSKVAKQPQPKPSATNDEPMSESGERDEDKDQCAGSAVYVDSTSETSECTEMEDEELEEESDVEEEPEEEGDPAGTQKAQQMVAIEGQDEFAN